MSGCAADRELAADAEWPLRTIAASQSFVWMEIGHARRAGGLRGLLGGIYSWAQLQGRDWQVFERGERATPSRRQPRSNHLRRRWWAVQLEASERPMGESERQSRQASVEPAHRRQLPRPIAQLDLVCSAVKANNTMPQFLALVRAAAQAARRPGFALNKDGLLDIPMPAPPKTRPRPCWRN